MVDGDTLDLVTMIDRWFGHMSGAGLGSGVCDNGRWDLEGGRNSSSSVGTATGRSWTRWLLEVGDEGFISSCCVPSLNQACDRSAGADALISRDVEECEAIIIS